MQKDKNQATLGLDVGAESIGWALIAGSEEGGKSILAAGSHRFDAAVEGDFASGRDESRAKARRDARQPRRQHWRRARRRRKILKILQRAGLLPPGAVDSPKQTHEFLLQLDREIFATGNGSGRRVASHTRYYRLRADALEQKLDPYAIGRAIYHLAQRRGFLSNRKSVKAVEDAGAVKQAIGHLREQMRQSCARTLGEYLAGLDPETERIRARWTARDMYTHEFDAIWKAQQQFHPQTLTLQLRKKLHAALFDQRPLKSQRHLLGHCELLPDRRRTGIARRAFQRFRILQAVNNLEVIAPPAPPRVLSPAERAALLETLHQKGDQTFAAVRKLFKLPKNSHFNLEEGGEKRLCGNRTDARLAAVLGETWDGYDESQRDQLVEDMLTIADEDAMLRRLHSNWGLSQEQAEALADPNFGLEAGFARLSQAAIARLLPRMEAGARYGEARREEFPERFATSDPLDRLPPVADALPQVRNPAVLRALTELRKLVNAIVDRFGKPHRICIELARDLKQPRRERQRASQRNRQNERARSEARKLILSKQGIANPSSADVQKVLLAEECNWQCPYTGRKVCMESLLGVHPQFDIEHIIPFSRSLDNSFVNKTLCYHQENRSRKHKLTPVEAYAAVPARWTEILDRVRRFRGDLARAKLRRFMTEVVDTDFTHRQLNETRETSRLAGDYLALLFGGRVDKSHAQRIFVSTGRITGYLRNEWGLNAILGDGGAKSREDHRHHAVDAIATALSTPALVKRLADAAARTLPGGSPLFAQVTLPWPKFIDDVRRVVLGDPAEPLSGIRVSMRPNKKVNGVLHAETLYSKAVPGAGHDSRHVRKQLHKLTLTDLRKDAIVDPVIRNHVRARWELLGGGDPAKVFADPANHPVLHTRDGRAVPIHKVRVKAKAKPKAVGKAARRRWVASKAGSNHLTVVLAILDEKGRELKWVDYPLTRIRAVQRLADSKRRGCASRLVRRDWGSRRALKFCLAPHDHVVMYDDHGVSQLYRVASVSKRDIELRLHADARTADALRAAKQRVRVSAEKLRKRNARKVRVTYLGEIVADNG